MGDRIIGFFLVVMGIASVIEGDRVMRDYREFAVFDEIGPDHYLQIIGILLAIFGVMMIVMSLRRAAAKVGAEEDEAAVGAGLWHLPTYVVFTVLLLLYAAVMRLIGYPAATVLFFIAAFYLTGCRPLTRTVAMGGVAGLVCYVLFVGFAEMPLPRTPWLGLM